MDGDSPTAPLMFPGADRGNSGRFSPINGRNTSADRSIEVETPNSSAAQTRSLIAPPSERDNTFSTFSGEEETSKLTAKLEAARLAYKKSLSALQETSTSIDSDDAEESMDENGREKAMALCLANHEELNRLEGLSSVDLTPLPLDFPTPIKSYQYFQYSRLSSSSSAQRLHSPPLGSQHPFSQHSPGDNYVLSFPQSRVHGSRTPEHGLRIQTSPQNLDLPTTVTLPRPSRRVLNFYDSFHPVKAIPTILGDTVVSAAAVDYFFTIDSRYGLPAWFLGNLFGSIVASHYVIRAIEARSPERIKPLVKGFLSPSEPLNYFWNPGYVTYYAIAWSIMGADKPVFNVTPTQALAFMIVSGIFRQLADQVINKKNPFSWNTKTWRPEVRNPFSWNQENINAIASSPRSQLWRASWEYLPDIIGASARSGSSHFEKWHKGIETLDVIKPQVKKSTGVYMLGLAAYYGVYRGIEFSLRSRYKEASEMNQRMLKRLYNNIQRAAHHGVSNDSQESESVVVMDTHFSEESNPLIQRNDTNTTPNRIITPTRTTPTRNLSRSSSSKALIKHPISREALIASLKVLRSHLISYFKDPIFYRMEFPCRTIQAPFKQAYSIIDLLEMYKSHVTNETDGTKIRTASKELLATLRSIRLTAEQVESLILRKTENGDVENQLSCDRSLEKIPFLDILPLLHLFDRYAGTNPYKDKPHTFELTPLRGAQNGNSYGATAVENTYGSINGENGQTPFTDDDLFSDDSDLDDEWAPR